MKTLIAVPCMDMIHTKFASSLLSLDKDEGMEVQFGASSLVYDTRNQFIAKVLDEEYDRLLFVDSDMSFTQTEVGFLFEDLDRGYDIVCALAFTKRQPKIHPVIFNRCELLHHADGRLEPACDIFLDYPKDCLFQVAAMGCGMVAMNVEAVRRIADKYGQKLFMPIPGFGEDISFCIRAQNAGEKLYCDSRASIGHVGQQIYDEKYYLAQS